MLVGCAALGLRVARQGSARTLRAARGGGDRPRARPAREAAVGLVARGEASLLLLVIGCGWYVVAAVRNAGFLWYTVVDNHLLNALRLRHFPDEDIPLSALEFLAVSGLGALPVDHSGRAWR